MSKPPQSGAIFTSHIKLMTVRPVTVEDFPLIEAFIKPYEAFCVQLAASARRKAEKLFLIEDEADGAEAKSGLRSGALGAAGAGGASFVQLSRILGLFSVDYSLFHCIPLSSLEKIKADKEIGLKIRKIISGQKSKNGGALKVKCVSGEREASDFFIEILEADLGRPVQVNHYKLMANKTAEKSLDAEVEGSDAQPKRIATIGKPATAFGESSVDPIKQIQSLSNDDQIIRCTENDFDLIFQLQKKYLTEEVAPCGRAVTDAEVSIGLRQILKSQLCLALLSDGQVAAKANTNAIGFDWVQLGGIYTHPLFRRNGYARHLVATICRRVAQSGKSTALFVKEKNLPAISLYKSLGFVDCGSFSIAYF